MQIFVPTMTDENEHLNRLETYFGAIRAGPVAIPKGQKFIFLCYTNRCGSDYVAQSIASDGRLNIAGEFFNHDTVLDHAQRLKHKNIQTYFNWLVGHVRRGRRMVCKVAVSHLEVLGRAGILQQIMDRSHFILVERNDKLGQAISYDIALQTGKWNSRVKPRQQHVELAFSADRLTTVMRSFAQQYTEFDRFFDRNGVFATNIVYEHFLADVQPHLEVIGRQLDLPGLQIVPENIWIQKQAGPTNIAWRERYLAETADD